MKAQKQNPPEPPKCMYNDGVVCWPKEKDCDNCGWCPKVEARRNRQFRERMAKI
jgi:hypothetical protein